MSLRQRGPDERAAVRGEVLEAVREAMVVRLIDGKLLSAEQSEGLTVTHNKVSTVCSKCGGDRDQPNQRYCRACHSAYKRDHRKSYGELSDAEKKKSIARSIANVYQNRGLLEKQICEGCGSESAEKHHDDYDEPLKIRWLCRECHMAEHNENRLFKPPPDQYYGLRSNRSNHRIRRKYLGCVRVGDVRELSEREIEELQAHVERCRR